MIGFELLFLIYGILAISHITVQVFLGHLEYKKQAGSLSTNESTSTQKVSIIVPVYNEQPFILEHCIKRLLAQEYSDYEVIVVDDGSTNRDQLMSTVYQVYYSPKVRIVLLNGNYGKRIAQKTGFDLASGNIIVTVDSDTLVQSKKTLQIMARRFRQPFVGAITGDVRVENKNKNLLTRLINYRYWIAFHQERAAQSYFYVLMCCSGPLSAYRRSILDKIKGKYINQTFLGKRCTFGDDRHLTNLVLEEGLKVVFEKDARATTYVPENIGQYLRQQLRWNKSFYREMFWTLRFCRQHHWYLLYELIMQSALPFLLLATLLATVYQGLNTSHIIIWLYIISLVWIALIRACYGIYRTGDVGFLLFAFYGFLHVLLLIPTRIYALLTLDQTHWGTR